MPPGGFGNTVSNYYSYAHTPSELNDITNTPTDGSPFTKADLAAFKQKIALSCTRDQNTSSFSAIKLKNEIVVFEEILNRIP